MSLKFIVKATLLARAAVSIGVTSNGPNKKGLLLVRDMKDAAEEVTTDARFYDEDRRERMLNDIEEMLKLFTGFEDDEVGGSEQSTQESIGSSSPLSAPEEKREATFLPKKQAP